MALHPTDRRLLACGVLLFGVIVLVAVRGCHGGRRLVEVFDNGPVGGARGPSEGYLWVGEDDSPPPGKTWQPVDPGTLSKEERERIR